MCVQLAREAVAAGRRVAVAAYDIGKERVIVGIAEALALRIRSTPHKMKTLEIVGVRLEPKGECKGELYVCSMGCAEGSLSW